MPLSLRWHDAGTLKAQTFPGYEDILRQRAARGPIQIGFARLERCALIGAYEDFGRALRTSYVDGRFPVIRRQTGGGSLSLDPGSTLLVAAFPADCGQRRLSWWIKTFAGALLAGLKAAGIESATFDEPNDIVLDGRKFASLFVTIGEQTVLCEAVFAITLDVEELLKTLRLPLEKLSEAGIQAAANRFAPLSESTAHPDHEALCGTLAASLAARFGVDLEHEQAPCLSAETPSLTPHSCHFDISAFLKTPGGVLYLDLALTGTRITHAQWTGAVQVGDGGLFARLAAGLIGREIRHIEGVLAKLVPTSDDLLRIHRDDLLYLGHLCAARHWLAERLGLADANRVTLFSPERTPEAEALFADIGTVLLPYCAKPAWCKWRHRDGCPECGRCAIGEAYGMARERGLQVTTITHYEHLRQVLADLKAQGVRTFLGVCCTDFFLKRDYAFIEAGLAAVLVDIGGETCYTLRAEEEAYAGRFTAEAVLDAGLFANVLKLRDRFIAARTHPASRSARPLNPPAPAFMPE